MRLASLLFALPVVALSLSSSTRRRRPAAACFHGETENTQVTGHKMILSVSQAETTLWDQILVRRRAHLVRVGAAHQGHGHRRPLLRRALREPRRSRPR